MHPNTSEKHQYGELKAVVRVIKSLLRQRMMKTCQWKRSCEVGRSQSAKD